MSPGNRSLEDLYPEQRERAEIILQLATVWNIDSPKALAKRLVDLRHSRFAGLDGLVLDSDTRDRFMGWVKAKAMCKDDGAGAMAAVIGRTLRARKRGTVRVSPEQQEAHAKELAHHVFSRPEVLLGGGPGVADVDPDQLVYAREHLKAYLDVQAAGESLRAKEAERNRLVGKPNAIALIFGGDMLVEGEAGELLLHKVREVTETLYPRVPEQPQTGPPLPQCTYPTEIAKEVWMDVGAQEGVGGRMGFSPVIEPFDGRWRVCRLRSTAYAVVAKEQEGKTAELKDALDGLVMDPDLRRLYREAREARKQVDESRTSYLALVRELGTRIRHGALLKGACNLGY
jgi:hypothetical protein